MISPRYALAACVTVALALVPTVIHSYFGFVVDDGRRVESIAGSIDAYSSLDTNRDQRWGKRQFDSDDWFDRRYISGPSQVMLTAIRSYDLKKLYHHPELAVAYGIGYLDYEVQSLPAMPGVPVHVLSTGDERPETALYVLHYDAGFVDDPLWLQIREAGRLLFSGRKPMTLLFARQVGPSAGGPLQEQPAAHLLTAAVQQFLGRQGRGTN